MRRINQLSFIMNCAMLSLCVAIWHYWPSTLHTMPDDELYCLVQNVYHEARGESKLGQIAVAYVTINRAKTPGFPSTICGTVWQKGQFSWTRDGRSDKMTDVGAIERAVDVSLSVIRGKVADPTGGMTFFYNPEKVRQTPKERGAEFYVAIGDHTFYTRNR